MRRTDMLLGLSLALTPFLLACTQGGMGGGGAGGSGGSDIQATGSGGLAVGSGGGVGNVGSGGSGGSGGSAAGGGSGVAADAETVLDASLCDQLSIAAELQFESYLDSQPMPCQSDSDCMEDNFETLDCFLSCGFVMGKADRASVATAAALVCDSYFAAGCPKMFALLCPAGAVPHASCSHGRCGGIAPGQDAGRT